MARSARPSTRLLGFRWHLLGLAAVALLPLVAFGALLVRRSTAEEQSHTERLLLENAQLLAGAIDRELATALRALETLSRSEQLRRGDLAGFRREAVRVERAQPAWIAVVLFTPDGRRIVDSREEHPDGGTVDAASFAEALRTRRPVVGDLVRARDGFTWADFIARAGHAVEVAHDGPAAVAAAEARRPDVVVLDVGLPVMDGYEVAEHLRERLGAAAPAIVGVTGYGQERDRARSREAGFLHHLVKPVDPAEVLAAVEDASGRAGPFAPAGLGTPGGAHPA